MTTHKDQVKLFSKFEEHKLEVCVTVKKSIKIHSYHCSKGNFFKNNEYYIDTLLGFVPMQDTY